MSKKLNKPVARLGVKDGEIAYPHNILDTDGQVHGKMVAVNDKNRRLMKEGNGLEIALAGDKESKIYPIVQTFQPKDDIGTIVIKV